MAAKKGNAYAAGNNGDIKISYQDFLLKKSDFAGFSSEAHIANTFERRIAEYTSQLSDLTYESHERERVIYTCGNEVVPGINKPFFGLKRYRIDFDIKTKEGKHIGVECKWPKNYYQEMQGVFQLLNYDVTSQGAFDHLVLITSSIDANTIEIIAKYSLPVTVGILVGRELFVWNN